MSGPAATTELDLGGETPRPEPAVVEITDSRESEVGSFRVRRHCHDEPAGASGRGASSTGRPAID